MQGSLFLVLFILNEAARIILLLVCVDVTFNYVSNTHQAEWYVKVKCTHLQCCDMNGKYELNENATYIIQN